jgi:phosphatidylserine/phosphatidylglycerophosphate/cardiolipin synthase-like enzyme
VVYGSARLRLPLLLLALLVASCAPGRTPPAEVAAIPMPVAAGPPVTAGADRLTPLPNGPSAFAAITGALESARRSIELELYEFQRLDLAALLLAAHDRGVTVTAIRDSSESSSASLWAELEQGGVRLVAFPAERSTIDHVKLLIVDRVVAIVGGINWGSHSELNHDVDVLATGPVVANLERVFRQDLALAGDPTSIPPPLPDPRVQVLVTRPGDSIRAAALSAIAAAHHSIDIAIYVLSDRLVLDALVSAVRRGVHIRALLDPTQAPNLDAMAELQAAGAEVRLYQQAGEELLHAKLAVFDRAVVLFGSCNWSRSGFTRNHELDLMVRDPALAATFLIPIERDWLASAA